MDKLNTSPKNQVIDSFNKIPKKQKSFLILMFSGLIMLTVPSIISFILSYIFPFMKGSIADLIMKLGLSVAILIFGASKALKVLDIPKKPRQL